MCFSASVSFVSSAVLAATGGAALSIAKKQDRLVAAIPLLFSVQQAIEGGQWLTPHPGLWSSVLGYGYLFFAFLFWPVYLPLAVYKLENQRRRRELLWWLVLLGAIVALALFVAITIFPVDIAVETGHVVYSAGFSNLLVGLGIALYTIAVVGAPLLSSRRDIRLFGFLLLAAEIAAAALQLSGFASLWCFFSALLSVTIYFYIRSRSKQRSR